MTKLNSTQIVEALDRAGVGLPEDVSIADRSYAAVDRGFLATTFSADLGAWIFQLFGKYAEEVRDCDDFARFAAAVAQLWNSKTAGNEGCALAFGEYWYLRDDGQAHAINIAVVGDNQVVFYEPQTQQIVELSDSEKERATLILF